MSATLTLPEAVRSIRRAWHMTTSEFGRELGIERSVVSRYESGERSPGRRVLLKLMLKAREAEREPIRQALSARHGRPIRDEEAVGMAMQIAKEEELLERVAAYFDLPERGRFVQLTSDIIAEGKEVDESLNTILSIWSSSSANPDRLRYFKDAARFLEIGLVPGAGETIEPLVDALREADFTGSHNDEPTMDEQRTPDACSRSSYRVILPVDLGDAVVHQPGEVINLDLVTANLYSHALMRIEPVRRSKKKSA